MAIEGPLKELGLHDVFRLLDLGRKTGLLRISSHLRDNDGTVFFDSGSIVFASIRSNPHRIGDRLVEGGCNLNASLTLLADPNVRGLVGHFRDITDRKLAELALRESEERLRALVQSGFDLLAIIDRAVQLDGDWMAELADADLVPTTCRERMRTSSTSRNSTGRRLDESGRPRQDQPGARPGRIRLPLMISWPRLLPRPSTSRLVRRARIR